MEHRRGASSYRASERGLCPMQSAREDKVFKTHPLQPIELESPLLPPS
jgi:hypothetical protein